MREKYLSPIEIAEDLDLTVKAVMCLIRKGELPAYRFNHEIRVRADHFKDFVNKAKIQEVSHGR